MRKFIPATLGLCLTAAGAAQGQESPAPVAVEPGRLALSEVSANQQLATTIAERLRMNAHLKHYRVDVTAAEGIVTLLGQVTDDAQRDEVVRSVQAVPGVTCVRDRLGVLAGSGVMPVGGTATTGQVGGGGMPPMGFPPEPLPIFSAGRPGMPNPHMEPPPLPPNAWPTYAPYNNYSRVAYPQKYPYEAWPFIGPMYPFPKVPLGWRSVTLSWRDGYWWYGREASGHDWWRIRYW